MVENFFTCFHLILGNKTIGESCASDKECNVAEGLVCGDMCNATEISVDRRCTCGPFHVSSGSSCVESKVQI